MSRNSPHRLLMALTVVASFAARANASVFETIPLGGYANFDVADNVANSPQGSDVLLGGIPFDMTNGRGYRAPFVNETQLEETIIFDDLSIAAPETVFLMLNSAWGIAGTHVSDIFIETSSGLQMSVPIVEGINIRDYAESPNWVNSVTDPMSIEVLSSIHPPTGWNSRIDRYQIELPLSWTAEILDSITIHSFPGPMNGGTLHLQGGITVQSIPEPSSALLLGAAGLAAICRRRSE